jgi:hypothetical protein
MQFFEAVQKLRRLVTAFSPLQPKFSPKLGHVGFVVDKVTLGQIYSEYFDFSWKFSFHQLLHVNYSLYRRRRIFSILSASLNKKTKKKKSTPRKDHEIMKIMKLSMPL